MEFICRRFFHNCTDHLPRPVLIFATNAVDDYSESAGTVSAPLVNENLFRLNCEMIRALIFETQGSPYELGAKSFQTPSVPIDKSYIHSPLPFAKSVFKEVFGQLVCPSLNEMNLVRKSFFARNVLLTQTSEHLDLMWEEGVGSCEGGADHMFSIRHKHQNSGMPQEHARWMMCVGAVIGQDTVLFHFISILFLLSQIINHPSPLTTMNN